MRVKDIHKTRRGRVYGYCGCGREVDRKDKRCPYCQSMLEWPEENKKEDK